MCLEIQPSLQVTLWPPLLSLHLEVNCLFNKTQFNTLLAKPRVKSQQCIGLLNGRFPFLKGICILLANKLHMDRILDHVRGAVILHNFLIKDPIEADWVEHKGDDDLEPEVLKNKSNEPDP
jgi:hypothetical protein